MMTRRFEALTLIVTMIAPSLLWAGPYSTALDNQTAGAIDAGVPGFVGPGGIGKTPTTNNGKVINPIFTGWATGVASYSPTPGVDSAWKNTSKVLGPVTGDNLDIVSLGDLYNPASPPATGALPPFSNDGRGFSGDVSDPNDGWGFVGIDPPGQITLSFTNGIAMGGGADFVVFENSAGASTSAFIELAYVEVSTNGIDFARFPSLSLNDTPVGFTNSDPTNYYNLAGKHINAGGNSWGTPFSLSDLSSDPLVQSGAVDLSEIWYVRLVDIPGIGTYTDSLGHVIYDPTPTYGSGGFDLEAIGVIHQAVPEASTLLLVGVATVGLFVGARNRRSP